MYSIYKEKNTDRILCILRLKDNASIPLDPCNTDYQEYLAWLVQGNTPEPADEGQQE